MSHISMSQMRQQLRGAYGKPGGKWDYRVSRMSDNQVLAIYKRLLEKDPIQLLSPEAKKKLGNK